MKRERPQPTPRDKALALLARREHSRLELSRKLAQSGYTEEDIRPLLDEFETRNWLSDRRFAESYVADHRARYGELKLAHELRMRGIADGVIEEVLTGSQDSERERAREVWHKKFGNAPGTVSEKARQIRFLQSRGFSLDIIMQTIHD